MGSMAMGNMAIRIRGVVTALLALAGAGLAGCETTAPEYYPPPPPPPYYGPPPPVVYYEYYYDPFWYPYRFYPGTVIVVPDEREVTPPRRRPLPPGVSVPTPPSPPPPEPPSPRRRPLP